MRTAQYIRTAEAKLALAFPYNVQAFATHPQTGTPHVRPVRCIVLAEEEKMHLAQQMLCDWRGDEQRKWATPVTAHRIHSGLTDNPLCEGGMVQVHWNFCDLPSKWAELPSDPDPNEAAAIREFFVGSTTEPTRLAIVVTSADGDGTQEEVKKFVRQARTFLAPGALASGAEADNRLAHVPIIVVYVDGHASTDETIAAGPTVAPSAAPSRKQSVQRDKTLIKLLPGVKVKHVVEEEEDAPQTDEFRRGQTLPRGPDGTQMTWAMMYHTLGKGSADDRTAVAKFAALAIVQAEEQRCIAAASSRATWQCAVQ